MCGALTVLAAMGASAPLGVADPIGSNGTIKIDGSPIDVGNDNDPHVGCAFTVELFGFDAGPTTGSVVFAAQSPTPGGSLNFPISFTAPLRVSGNTFDYGKTFDVSSLLTTLTPHPAQGYHLKVTVTVNQPTGGTTTKYKVFWVRNCTPAARISTFVGYADSGVGRGDFLPTPWQGSPNTTFVGTATGPYDAGVVELVNPTAAPISAYVTVSIGTTVYDVWGTRVIPANGNLVLTQMTPETGGVDALTQFDTSEDPNQGTCSAPSTIVPVIHVTISGVVTDYLDTQRVLTTGGSDFAECNSNANEGRPYTATTKV